MRWLPAIATEPRMIEYMFREMCNQGASASAAFWRQSMIVAQMLKGNQMWVSMEVSEDLRASDIDVPDFESVMDAFPNNRLEIVFEDPRLPDVLMSIDTRSELVSMLQKHGHCEYIDLRIKHRPGSAIQEQRLLTIMCQDAKGAIASIAYGSDDMNKFASTGDDPFPEHTAAHFHPTYNGDLTTAEHDMLRLLANLVHKLGLFLTSEGGAPAVQADAPTKKEGGKPGFKGRPKQKRWRVTYLPSQRHAKAQAVEDGRKHAFLGRRGFFRTYRHERYTVMKGRRMFIHPIPGPDGAVPRRFVVKKPAIPGPAASS